jgi:hypothetical protein
MDFVQGTLDRKPWDPLGISCEKPGFAVDLLIIFNPGADEPNWGSTTSPSIGSREAGNPDQCEARNINGFPVDPFP